MKQIKEYTVTGSKAIFGRASSKLWEMHKAYDLLSGYYSYVLEMEDLIGLNHRACQDGFIP